MTSTKNNLILVVDDSPQMIRLIKRELRKHGDVRIASTVKADAAKLAIESLGDELDILLTDYDIGSELNGLDLIRCAHPETHCILMSGMLPTDTIDAHATIEKPFTRVKLMAALGWEVDDD